MSEYWIEGDFGLWWTHKSFYDPERDIFIPKWAILNLDEKDSPGLISGILLINKIFALNQLKKLKTLQENNLFTWQEKEHYYLYNFCQALNKPYIKEKEEYVGPPTALP